MSFAELEVLEVTILLAFIQIFYVFLLGPLDEARGQDPNANGSFLTANSEQILKFATLLLLLFSHLVFFLLCFQISYFKKIH